MANSFKHHLFALLWFECSVVSSQAVFHLCRKAARGRLHAFWLQHPAWTYFSPCLALAWRYISVAVGPGALRRAQGTWPEGGARWMLHFNKDGYQNMKRTTKWGKPCENRDSTGNRLAIFVTRLKGPQIRPAPFGMSVWHNTRTAKANKNRVHVSKTAAQIPKADLTKNNYWHRQVHVSYFTRTYLTYDFSYLLTIYQIG